jgi:hypothetical protein
MFNNVFNKTFMVRFATKVNWKMGLSLTEMGDKSGTQRGGSKTNAGTGAECCASKVSRTVMKFTFCSHTVKLEGESGVQNKQIHYF